LLCFFVLTLDLSLLCSLISCLILETFRRRWFWKDLPHSPQTLERNEGCGMFLIFA
jgi:hypothetical protein